MRRILALGTATCLLCLIAPSADAYQVSGGRWSGGRVTYVVKSPSLRATAREAARLWNRSGARVRFVERKRGRASLTIRIKPVVPMGGVGFASIGAQPGAYLWIVPSAVDGVPLMLHEMGHVLGLGHVSNCAVMSIPPLSGCGKPPKAWQHSCSGPQPDDVRGAVRMYGGRARSARLWCDVAGPPTAPALPTVVPGFTPPRQFKPVVSVKAPRGSHTSSLEITRYTGTCPASDAAALQRQDGVSVGERALGAYRGVSVVFDPHLPAWDRKVPAGKVLRFSDQELPLGAARYCYRVVTADLWGRHAKAVTVIYDHKPPPPIPPLVTVTLTPADGNVMIDPFSETAQVGLRVIASDDTNIASVLVNWGDPNQPAPVPEDVSSKTIDREYSYRYSAPGVYPITIVLTDEEGGQTVVQRTVSVAPAPPPPPDPPPDPPVNF